MAGRAYRAAYRLVSSRGQKTAVVVWLFFFLSLPSKSGVKDGCVTVGLWSAVNGYDHTGLCSRVLWSSWVAFLVDLWLCQDALWMVPARIPLF